MNQLPTEQLYTERVYIDPQRLLRLKKERKPFKQVPSVFEPPPDTSQQPSLSTSPSLRPLRPSQPNVDPDFLARANCPNVDFILGLLGEVAPEQINVYEEGDCIGTKTDEKSVIVQGQVKVTGVGGRTFGLGEGSVLFISETTAQKVREVICIRASKVVRIPDETFSSLRNYIFLKNAEKIKYLKYCPFFIWSDLLSQDLAASMSMQVYERGHTLFSRGDQADSLFFVKEGVVLLERNAELKSLLFSEYQMHYERSQPSPSEATLVVKKGMVFGIDGILLRDSEENSRNRDRTNPEEQWSERRAKPTTRVYTARTLGRTEVYALKRQILEGLFDIGDLLSAKEFPRELTKNDLQRICSDYAEMVVRHRSLPKLSQVVSTKQMFLDRQTTSPPPEMLEKQVKVQQIRQRESITRKHSIANIIADSRGASLASNQIRDTRDINSSIVLQQHFSQKLGIAESVDPPAMGFPRITSNLRKKRVVKKDGKEEADRFIMSWIKCEDPSKGKPKNGDVLKKTSQEGKLSLINVRSYRSIVG